MYTQKLSDKKQRISLIRNHVTHIYICIYGPKYDFKTPGFFERFAWQVKYQTMPDISVFMTVYFSCDCSCYGGIPETNPLNT